MTDQITQEQVEGVTDEQVEILFDRFADHIYMESPELRDEVRSALELVRSAWPVIREDREILRQVAKYVPPDNVTSLIKSLESMRKEVEDWRVRDRLAWAAVLNSGVQDDNLSTALWVEGQRVASILDPLVDAISGAEALVSSVTGVKLPKDGGSRKELREAIAAGVKLPNDGGRRVELRVAVGLLLDTWWSMIGESGRRGWPPRGVAGGKKQAVEFVHAALEVIGIRVSEETLAELAKRKDLFW